ncbi:MAG TPA: DUF4423 domain-containing protein [Bdellovibrio sp.]|nr:DUF4423 domain-containing protein [Bdellovibrio sp.]
MNQEAKKTQNDPLVEILIKEFTQKKSRNRAYSLRSYSRDLGLDPSNLSKILKYQKEMGPRLRSKVGAKLGFSQAEIQGWLEPQPKNVISPRREYHEHNLQAFQVISDWQHYALLEYLKIQGADHKPAAMAKNLNLPLEKVQEALKRLLSVGLLQKTATGYQATDEVSSSILKVETSKAHRQQQKQILEGAMDALENVPIEWRSQSSMTMAIDTNKIEEAKELIKHFRRSLGRLLSSSTNLDSVYQLSVSLYPVTQIKK